MEQANVYQNQKIDKKYIGFEVNVLNFTLVFCGQFPF